MIFNSVLVLQSVYSLHQLGAVRRFYEHILCSSISAVSET